MALVVKRCDCDCADLEDACNCAGETLLAVECQSKDIADAPLCGFTEYGTPSTPPRYYRRKTLSGDVCTILGAEPFKGISRDVYSGNCQYDPESCLQANSFEQEQGGEFPTMLSDCSGLSTSPVSPPGCDEGDDYADDPGTGASLTETQTMRRLDFALSDPGVTEIDGFKQVNLEDEDTAEDAVDRAASSEDWEDSTCGSDPCCNTHLEQSGGNASGRVTRARVPDEVLTGLTIGHNYKLTHRIAERASGSSDPYVWDDLVVEAFFTAAATSEDGPWIDVPKDTTKDYKCIGAILEDLT